MSKRICFVFPEGTSDSGQRKATELIIQLLGSPEYKFWKATVPVLERNHKSTIAAAFLYIILLSRSWFRMTYLFFGMDCVHWSIGQTRMSWIRDGLPIIFFKFLYRYKVVISINGSNFMFWKPRCFDEKIFSFLLGEAMKITVLGDKQRRKVIALGIPESVLRVVPNTCEYNPISKGELRSKLEKNGRPTLLFLSSLIDTKGYPVFLDAVENLCIQGYTGIDCVLCGRITGSQFSKKFFNEFAARDWILKKLERINSYSGCSMKWINGAWSEDKRLLFYEADIFCLPTEYQVEAQPLVLLEAMSQGCAIITSTVGEIETILDKGDAVMLESISVERLEREIEFLLSNNDVRQKFSESGWLRYKNSFGPSTYKSRWEEILSNL